MTRKVRFTIDDEQRAFDEWGCNCGPAALCAVLNMTPDEIRPHLREFERKRYTNPSLMAAILRDLGIPFKRHYECLGANRPVNTRNPYWYPEFGLMRVQWDGPWTRPGVPIRARYRHTHWIAVELNEHIFRIFDVNAMCVGGWISWSEWERQLVPWLLRQTEPKATGEWWPTHSWQIPENQK